MNRDMDKMRLARYMSSSANADDPVTTELGKGHYFGFNSLLGGYWMPRLRGA